MVLQAGGQGQLHVGAQANCKADTSCQHRERKHPAGSHKIGASGRVVDFFDELIMKELSNFS